MPKPGSSTSKTSKPKKRPADVKPKSPAPASAKRSSTKRPTPAKPTAAAKKAAASPRGRTRATASREKLLPSVSSTASKLVIVESPAKAKTLRGYLGPDYLVQASVGHVRDLPQKRLGVDLESDFEPEYEIITGKEDVVELLRRNASSMKSIFLATDPDREGEAIAFHVAHLIGGSTKRFQRVLFNEITKDAVQRALAKPGEIDLAKVDAQQARRVLDRLVGYLVSPLLQKIIARGLSAGRVQSVALRLICEREAEIRAFVAQEYWTIDAHLLTAKREAFVARLARIKGEKAEVADDKTAKQIVAAAAKHPFKLSDLATKPRKSSPSAPYTTSTLQQDAARRLGYSNDRTMRVAQSLYEGVDVGKEGSVGLITYMRTDSTRCAPEAIAAVREFIGSGFGADYVPAKPRQYVTKKSAQDAHEAIRPTDVMRDPAKVKRYLDADQFKLYELIWKRFVASQMADAKFDVTTAVLVSGIYEFQASGRRVIFPGHLAAMAEFVEEKNGDEAEQLAEHLSRELPPLEVGKTYALDKLDPQQHFTQPPPRYNAGSLVKTLDELAIGRPSTYASIISVLVKRKYIDQKERRFHPTTLGETVSKLLVAQFPDVFNVSFTAQMEEELDEIENDGVAWRKVVKDFYGPFRKNLDKVTKRKDELKKATTEQTDKKCPDCGSPLVVKWGRSGQFLGCSAYPECKHTQPLDGDQAPKAPDKECPKCGKPMAVKRGRFGWFYGCTGYPDCRTILPLEDKESVPCPRDGCGGQVSMRRSKRGKSFWGCSKYPECDFVSWNKPVRENCPNCGNTYMEDKTLKTGRIFHCPKCKHKIEVATEQA
ncbi:type I DNA topoisomerase [candidate division KSB1 bacterium]|nr:type I DNA topoisomerase [candidate division KSB1 bacterium]